MNHSVFTWEMYDGKLYYIAKVLKILKTDYYLLSSMFSKIEMYTFLFCSLGWEASAFVFYFILFYFCGNMLGEPKSSIHMKYSWQASLEAISSF